MRVSGVTVRDAGENFKGSDSRRREREHVGGAEGAKRIAMGSPVVPASLRLERYFGCHAGKRRQPAE